MYKHLHVFQMNRKVTAVALPFEVDSIIEDWHNLRKIMIKNIPAEFTRDEWAYLIAFLAKENLHQPFDSTFGNPLNIPSKPVSYLARPRGNIGLWLPNNVSLLGPLMLVLLGLSGNPIRAKAGSQSENLTGIFLNFALQNLLECQLKEFLAERVTIECFDRSDPRNQEMAAESSIRIAFGSDEAVKAIDSMPHPVESVSIPFIDRRSEAWVEKEALNDEEIEALIKVFAIYGQAGCTSPKKVVIIDGNMQEAVELQNRVIEMWPKIMTRLPPQHVASSNIMACQWARALGWEVGLTENNGAVVAAGTSKMPMFTSLMSLPITWATVEEAANSLPENIQTIGHAFKDSKATGLLKILADTKVKRIVPLSSMHHFGHVWDGYAFWRQLFEEVEVLL
jgi:hypothetical protein